MRVGAARVEFGGAAVAAQRRLPRGVDLADEVGGFLALGLLPVVAPRQRAHTVGGDAAEQHVRAGAGRVAAGDLLGLRDGGLAVAEQVARLRQHEPAVLVGRIGGERCLGEVGGVGPQHLGRQHAAVGLGLQQVGARQHGVDRRHAGSALARLVEQRHRLAEAPAAAKAPARRDDPLDALGFAAVQLQEGVRRRAEALAVLGGEGLLPQRVLVRRRRVLPAQAGGEQQGEERRAAERHGHLPCNSRSAACRCRRAPGRRWPG